MIEKKIYKKYLKDKQDDEKYIKLIRRSIIAYFLSTFSDLFMLLVWWSLIYLGWIWLIYWNFKIHIVEFIILIFYYLIILFFWFYFWYNTFLLITTHRIEKHSPTYLFWHHKEILWYREINKISFYFPTFIAKLLDYWTLEIIAWEIEKQNIIFPQAPNPEKLVLELRKFKKASLNYK